MAGNPDFSIEASHGGLVAGIDEAGRGPWAGPVVAAAVILNPTKIPAGINDSKKLSGEKREALFDAILASATCGIGIASVEDIDSLNIWGATKLAMQRAVHELGTIPSLALVDGKLSLPLPCPVQPIIGGDARSQSIAAASILAKVSRDRIMQQLSLEYPHYGWKTNAGYGTAEHIAAIERYGICPHHRKSFRPIREFIENRARQTA